MVFGLHSKAANFYFGPLNEWMNGLDVHSKIKFALVKSSSYIFIVIYTVCMSPIDE